jgi:hypothetical protein
LRREDSGAAPGKRITPHEAALRRLRALPTRPLGAIAAEGDEFTLMIARRLPGGEIVLVGELPGEDALLERAARKLAG